MKSIKLALSIVLVGIVGVASGSGTGPNSNAAVPQGSELPAEAAAGFDNQTNGLVTQDQFDTDLTKFNEREQIADGLGPVYNAQSCAECHQNPVSGSSSQVLEVRAGHLDGAAFNAPPGSSLIHSRAIDARIQERVPDGYEVRALRASVSTLGDGFVEVIDDNTLMAIANNQPAQSNGHIGGQAVMVPLLEAPGVVRVGRFGWKDQHASLLSFSGDAYLNEVGITNPLFPTENLSNGNSVAAFDTVADPEDNGADIQAFARFIRATKAPPRDELLAASPEARAGSQIFDQIGCAICHVREIVTAPAGAVIAGGVIVPQPLGGKVIHPFGDFLLHDIGTGDGIVQTGDQSTRNKLRTAPLWGVRARNQLMHDGQSMDFNGAILRHGGEARNVTRQYRRLEQAAKNQLIAFLKSL
jgi:CxxC motif-containing protein (DUF1111 family)